MLDWPEQSQTSPTRMSVSWMVSCPALTVIVSGPLPLSRGGRVRRQRPSAFARVRAECGPTSTVTVRPGAAQPQIGRGWSRWRTMWSVKMLAIRNVGCSSAAYRRWPAVPPSNRATIIIVRIAFRNMMFFIFKY